MNAVIDELRELVKKNTLAFAKIPEPDFSHKPAPSKWSKKEIIGHLIDSAHNNFRRFVTGQYEEVPPRIRYEQDFWVQANQYQEMNKEELIQLWKLMNERIAIVLQTMDPEKYNKECDSGKSDPELYSLEFLAQDYIVHMKHHLRQIFSE
jgi:hypothetical protein